jgi:hypothetical protein
MLPKYSALGLQYLPFAMCCLCYVRKREQLSRYDDRYVDRDLRNET